MSEIFLSFIRSDECCVKIGMGGGCGMGIHFCKSPRGDKRSLTGEKKV